MNKSYRIHTNIGDNKVLKVNMSQEYDFLEILTMRIDQEETYRIDSSNYGIIVGRVLANDAFGIPNAKVSVFIPISDEDYENTEIRSLYNYFDTTSKNYGNVRYNLLPDSSNDDCYRVVGTFPNKRLVLDDNTTLEVFDKYYKYTTVTNNSGDYMIYGIPTGNTQLHVDIDLSDIGVLSQKPRDFMYKGYTETLFDSSEQFKGGTNLDDIAQIISQDQGVYVYPFYSDEESTDVGITRCDIQVQYKFEPTCVFFGSIISDSYGNNIQPTCTPNANIGRNKELICGDGTIEMIRKTTDGLVEEYQIQGNQLIDGDGVWCYQIPMNLDYVGMDEYGNIVATDNPNKGIPTRTRVRFRFSMVESENDAMSRHRAKYLVPNNPQVIPTENMPSISACSSFDKHYEFGSSTLEEDFRDLYWNKVYSVKNYIPRLQTIKKVKTKNYSGIRSVNTYESKNPFPYNKVRFYLPFAFRMLCIIIKILIGTIMIINALMCTISFMLDSVLCIWIPIPFAKDIKICPLKPLKKYLTCIPFAGGLTDSDNSNVAYYPGCWCDNYGNCPDDMEGCSKSTSMGSLYDIIEQSLAQEYDIIHLDFYNDWVNGTLYMPLWHWKKTKKKSYFFGLFRKRAKNIYCDCDKQWGRLRLMDSCTMNYTGATNDNGSTWHHSKQEYYTKWGMIKNIVNKDGLNLYYYSSGVIVDPKPTENPPVGHYKEFARYFATDIILLGSFNSCDTEGLPQPYRGLPSTTSSIPAITTTVQPTVDEESNSTEGTTEEEGDVEVTGMDWLHGPERQAPYFGRGLLMSMDCRAIYTKPKSCVNISRLSELGVNYDMSYTDVYANNGNTATTTVVADGVITKIELDDYETRAMFATLNHRGLTQMKTDPSTGYKIYDFRYLYPVDFDGRQNDNILRRYKIFTHDYADEDYLLFRFGPDWEHDKNGRPTTKRDERITHNYTTNEKPSSTKDNNFFPYYNNSFYFYFGLNEGKTAIDKFRNKFTATCSKNVKYPFTIDVDKIIPKWCIYDASGDTRSSEETDVIDTTKCGVIDVNLPNIKTPYSYVLSTQETGDVIIKENNVKLHRLIFGVSLTENEIYEHPNDTPEHLIGDDRYYQTSDGKFYVKDGKVHAFKDFPKIVKENTDSSSDSIYYLESGDSENNFYIHNGNYNLTITDVNGKTEKVSISLAQQPINVQYENDKLGIKFIPMLIDSETEEYTTFDYIYENGNYGEINVSGVTIDGDEYKITACTLEEVHIGTDEAPSYEEYKLQLESKDGSTNQNYDVQLKVYVTELAFPNDLRFSALTNNDTFINIACQSETPNIPTSGYNLSTPIQYTNVSPAVDVIGFKEVQVGDDMVNVLYFYPCVPGRYTFVFTQYCNGSPNDNSSTLPMTIHNGEMFDALINDVPIRVLNTDENMWYNTDNPSNYNFPHINDNETLWSEYISYNKYIEGGGEEDEELTEYADSKTRLNALLFKFKSLFNLSKAVKFTDDGNNSFSFSINGGKNTVAQVYYPTFNEFGELVFKEDSKNVSQAINMNSSMLNKWTLDTKPSVSCDSSHPNVISYNYKAFFYSNQANSGFINQNYNKYYVDGDTIGDVPSYGGNGDFNKSDLMPFATILKTVDGYGLNGYEPYGFNSLINNSKNNTINYFAAFTNNAGLDGTKFESIPSNSQPIASNGKLVTFEARNTAPSNYYQQVNDWFKYYFVDNRIGFRGVIMTSTPSLAKYITEENNNQVVLKGRFTLQTIGGSEMAYMDRSVDDTVQFNRNVIQKLGEDDVLKYEYGYSASCINPSEEDVVIVQNNGEDVHKCFYTASLESNGAICDFRYAMVNSTLPLTREETIYPEEEEGEPTAVTVGNYSVIYTDENRDVHIYDYVNGYSGDTSYSGVGMNNNIENLESFYNQYSEYPIRRYTDIIGQDISGRVGLTLESTSFDVRPSVEYDDFDSSYSAATVVGITSPTDSVELDLDCSSIYRRATNSIDTCVETGNFDVLYNCRKTGINSLACGPSCCRLSLGYGTDNTVDSSIFSYTTYRPFIIKFSGPTASSDMISAITSIKFDSRNNDYSPYDTYEYVLNHYDSQIIKMKGITEGVEDYVWGLNETSNKYYKNLYTADSPNSALIYPDNSTEISMVKLYLEPDTVIQNGNIWTYTEDKAYGYNRACEIVDNCFLLFGGREYYQINRDCMIERDLRVFDFSQAYTFPIFTISNISSTATRNEQTIDFDISFNISGISIINNYLEVGFKVWNASADVGNPIEEQDLYQSSAEPISTTEAIVHAKGSIIHNDYNITLQCFFKNGDGLVYGTSFKINVQNGQIPA